jgi:hypothetical protein
MHILPSSLTAQERSFAEVREALAARGFSLGGNWDYDHGSFDCPLDEARQVWLRLPFRVTVGSVDSETTDRDAWIRFEQPFVLKHVYNEGADPEARFRLFGALTDQFQDPVDADAPIEAHWIEQATRKLREVEAMDQV